MKDKTVPKNNIKKVLSQQLYFYDGFNFLKNIRWILIGLNILLIASLLYKVTYRLPPQYFASSPEGRIITIHPLTDAVRSDSFITQWVSDKVRKSFSLDYLHYKDQLQEVAQAFTPNGWTSFSEAWNSSLNLKTLTADKMIADVTLTAAPVIERKGINGDRYAWMVNLSLLMTFNSKEKTIPMPFDVSVIVIRVPVKDYPDLIAINNFLPVVNKAQLNAQ